jgi:hypothetical protein
MSKGRGRRKKSKAGLLCSCIVISLVISGVLASCAPEPTPAGTPFEGCIEASSFEDYYKKAEFPLEYESEWMSEWLTPVPIPVKMNFSDIEIYNVPVEQMGANMFFTPIIKSGNLYCELTDSNAKILFAPIEKEEAVSYLILRLVTLGGSAGAVSCQTILAGEDYDKVAEGPGYICERPVPESERRVTTIEDTENGFLVNWVYYTPLGYRAGYYEDKLKINHDGRIEFLEEVERPLEPFIDCGPGLMM